jgi:NAD(P)H-flavin reductase
MPRKRPRTQEELERYREKRRVYMLEWQREYRKKNRDTLRAKHRASYRSNKGRVWSHHLKKYGLTPDRYEQMIAERNGRCWVCGDPPKGRHVKRLAIDHCHKTNKVRGLLCDPCNQGLGKFQDDPKRLLMAALYLQAATNAS